MKHLRLVLALALTLVAGKGLAQEFGAEWGENLSQKERHGNVLLFNYYKDAYQAGRYDDAIGFYKELIIRAPKAMMNTYVYAVNIYKSKIAKATNVKERNAYVDTMMTVYDLRIKYFGDNAKYGRAYILKEKASSYAIYRKTDGAGIRAIFAEAVYANNEAGDNDLKFINQYFNFLTEGFKADEVETDEYLNEYERLAAIVESMPMEGNEDQLKTFETLFVSSNAANCEKLEQIFTARLANDPNNAEQLKKAFGMLTSRKCSSDFYFSVGERYFTVEPSSAVALTLATAFEVAGRYQKSLQYLRQAVNTEEDPLEKGKLCAQIASTELQMENYQTAADFARQAIGFNPEYGFAYLILGYAYAGGTRSCGNPFDQRTVYWLAYDVTRTAAAKLTDEAQVKMANDAMARYARNFPTREDLFFRDISLGSGYTVRCGWISGGTSARTSD